jgi:WD40 repeat protein
MAAALAPVTAEALTPDGRTLVTAGADSRIRLWDRDTRALRATLRALTDGSWIVDRADGSRYASESLRDGTSPLLYRPPTR